VYTFAFGPGGLTLSQSASTQSKESVGVFQGPVSSEDQLFLATKRLLKRLILITQGKMSSLTGSRLDFSVLNLFMSRIKRLRVKILISLAFIVGDLLKNNVNVDYPTSFSLSYINQAFNSFTKTNIFL
jgi:hypothetical protein